MRLTNIAAICAAACCCIAVQAHAQVRITWSGAAGQTARDAAAGSGLASASASAGAVTYPARNQSPKQDMDKFACDEWARTRPGSDSAKHAPQAELRNRM